MKPRTFDLDFGYLLCVGFKSPGGPIYCPSVADYPPNGRFAERDFPLVRDVYKIICDAELIITWYGKQFDWKGLQTRMILAGCPPLPPLGIQHVDLYWVARNNFALHSRRLEAVAQWLGCPFKKTPLNGPIWTDASAGDSDALAYVIKHCKQDVKILEWVDKKLRPYVRQHPLVIDRGHCAVCGSHHLQFRGYAMRTTSKNPKQRIQCQDCGRWSLR